MENFIDRQISNDMNKYICIGITKIVGMKKK